MADDRPEYFDERPGPRYYWNARGRLAEILKGLEPAVRIALFGRDTVTPRLPDARDAAYEECRAITARIRAYLDGRPIAAALAGPAERDLLRRTPGTLAHAIADYKASKGFAKVEPRSRKQYGWMLGLIEEWGGHLLIKGGITYKRVMAAAERLADKPRSQQLFLTLLAMLVDRQALREAVPGEIVANPVRLVLKEVDKPEAKGGWIWPAAAVQTFAAAAEALGWPSIGTAVILNEWLAQRTGDLLSLPRTAYREGVLHFVQSKTGQYAPIPLDVIQHLKDRLEWQFEQDKKRAVAAFAPETLLICETTRAPWSLDYFRHEFARVRAALAGEGPREDLEKLQDAGIGLIGGFTLDAVPKRLWRGMAKGLRGLPVVKTIDLRFYHLRHTGITRLREAGCSDDEIRSISGHTQPATVYKHYLAVTVEHAKKAFGRRAGFEADTARAKATPSRA